MNSVSAVSVSLFWFVLAGLATLGCEDSGTDDEGLPAPFEFQGDFDFGEIDILVYWSSLTCEQECPKYCAKMADCDENGFLTEQWLQACRARCEPGEDSMPPNLISCSRLKDCDTFLQCVEFGGMYTYEQFESEATTTTEVVHCQWQTDISGDEDAEPEDMYFPDEPDVMPEPSR